MHRPPGAEAEPGAQQARDDDREQEVARERAEPEPDRPVGGDERDERVLQPDRGVAVGDRRRDVNDEEDDREQRQLRCRPATTKRGTRLLRQRTLVRTPRHTLAVSSTSVDDPRAARQVPEGARRAVAAPARPVMPQPPSRRASRRSATTEPSARRAGRRARVSPARPAPVAEHDRRRAGGVGLDARGRRDADRPPGAGGRPARARIEDVVDARRPRSASAAPCVLEVARPPARIATVGPGVSSGAAVIVGDPDRPAAVGGLPGDGDVAAERDQDTRAGDVRAAAAATRSAASALAVAPRSSSTPAGTRRSSASVVELDRRASRPAGSNEGCDEPPVAEAAATERAVVAGEAQRTPDASDRRARRSSGRPKRDLERVPEDVARPAPAVRRRGSARRSSESARKRLQARSKARSLREQQRRAARARRARRSRPRRSSRGRATS